MKQHSRCAHSTFLQPVLRNCSTAALLLSLTLSPVSVYAETGGSASHHGEQDKPKKQEKTEKKSSKKSQTPLEEGGFSDPALPTPADFEGPEATFQPIDAVILLDASGSMKNTDPARLRDKAAKLFLRFLKESDRVALVEFDTEPRLVLPFTSVNSQTLGKLDTTVEEISIEGKYTDLQSPTALAIRLIEEQGRKDALRTVIVLTDGKMDPHPSRGGAEGVVRELFQRDLPLCESQRLSLYTVGLGESSDSALLKDMAQQCGGAYWFAGDANSVHRSFSELFLALRKPQVAPLEKNGFEIDPSIREATFYITREDENAQLTLLTPSGEEMTNTDFPANTKWFRGNKFDIITISQPQPGRWEVRGIEEVTGFATLVTDLQLQVRWPASKVRLGQPLTLSARLTEKGEVLRNPQFQETTFYNYKILNAATGEQVASGALRDDGLEGDTVKGDFVSSAQLKVEKTGEYKIFVGVLGPTFTRQQQLTLEVTSSLVSLQHLAKDPFLRKPERIQVVVNPEAMRWSELRLQVVARKENQVRGYLLQPTPIVEKPGMYEIDPSVLPAAEYNIRAKIEGIDSRGREAQEYSDILGYIASNVGEALPLEPEERTTIVAKILFAVASTFLWCWGLYRFFLQRRRDGVRNSVGLIQGIELESEFYQGLSLLRDAPAGKRRAVREADKELFSLVGDIYNEPHQFEEVLNRHRGESPVIESSVVEEETAAAVQEHDHAEPEAPEHHAEEEQGKEEAEGAAEVEGERHS